MSTLTQFLPQGDSFTGEFTAASSAVWGANPTFGSKEYLQTGFTKTYTSSYSSLATNLRTAVLNDEEVAFSTAWPSNASGGSYPSGKFYGGPCTFYVTGGFLHLFMPGSCNPTDGWTYLAWGADSTAGYTTSTISSLSVRGVFFSPAPRYNGGAVSSAYFKSYVITSIYTWEHDPIYEAYGRILSSNSNSYTIREQSPANTQPTWLFCASSSICIGLANGTDQSAASSCRSTTNGTTFSSTAANTNFQTPGGIRHFAYSQCGNVFIVITANGNIYTADGGNGLTYTQRTTPTGMPTSSPSNTYLTYGAGAQLQYTAGTATENYTAVGSPDSNKCYLLKTTDGTSFTLVNLVDTAPSLRGIMVGFANTNPQINYAAGKYFLNYGALVAFSTDAGLTWQLDYTKYRSSFTTGNLAASYFKFAWGGSGVGSFGVKMYGDIRNSTSPAGGRYVYMNERYALSTPQLIGTTAALTFASGSSYSVYLRIK